VAGGGVPPKISGSVVVVVAPRTAVVLAPATVVVVAPTTVVVVAAFVFGTGGCVVVVTIGVQLAGNTALAVAGSRLGIT
jgi:hypothetical protein